MNAQLLEALKEALAVIEDAWRHGATPKAAGLKARDRIRAAIHQQEGEASVRKDGNVGGPGGCILVNGSIVGQLARVILKAEKAELFSAEAIEWAKHMEELGYTEEPKRKRGKRERNPGHSELRSGPSDLQVQQGGQEGSGQRQEGDH